MKPDSLVEFSVQLTLMKFDPAAACMPQGPLGTVVAVPPPVGGGVLPVPAGVVVADPLTLSDAVLMRREHIVAIERSSAPSRRGNVADLRLGSAPGTVGVTLAEAQTFPRRRGRHDAALQDADVVLVSTVLTAAFVRTAAERRMKTR